MVKAGIPIAEAIDTIIAQTKSKIFKDVLGSILKDIENGQSLAKALKKHPHIFDELYVSLIEVGEEAGTLEENLVFLADQQAKDYAVRQKIQGALLYPAIVFFAITVMGGFIALFILPQLVDFFGTFEIELPLPTKILLFFALLMKNFGLLIVAMILALFVGGSFLIKTSKVKPYWHGLLLRIPLIGTLLSINQLSRFSRNLGVLLKSGVPVTRSLETTAQTLSNIQFKTSVLLLTQSVNKGNSLGETMKKKQFNMFPPLVSKMVTVGEKTGKLDEMLLYLAAYYEDDIDNVSKNLTTVLEPILLIIVGLIVGFVALAVISPIYELTGSIGR